MGVVGRDGVEAGCGELFAGMGGFLKGSGGGDIWRGWSGDLGGGSGRSGGCRLEVRELMMSGLRL